MVTEKQISLIQTSWSQVVPIQHLAAGIFYTKLFSIDPSLKTLFPERIDEQKKKLMATLNVAVGGLNNLESLIPVLQRLAVRHISYGVSDEHFPLVGEALLYTLKTGLGKAFTGEVAEAWAALYRVISDLMVESMDIRRQELEGVTASA